MATKKDYQKMTRAHQVLNKNLNKLLKTTLKDWKSLVRELGVRDWGIKGEHRVVFELEDGADVSFDLLAQLADLFGTKKINVHGGSRGTEYSEYTYDPAMPTEIHVVGPDLTAWDELGLLEMNWR